jgi:hypothetical protein
MAFAVGDRVAAPQKNRNRLGGLGNRSLHAPRRGVIEEVLRGDPNPRYRIRWDDGTISVYSPTDNGLRSDDPDSVADGSEIRAS